MGQSETRERALSLVGQGYIYGAKGQLCNPSFRRGQAAQYPDQADRIMGEGVKWDGKPVWDCAQLTRTAAAYGGVTLPSGATSQWQRGPWKRKGTIDTLPTGEVVFLYRESGGKMQHTGVALGDGTEVDARGTSAGVVRKGVSEYRWTHWASPWDLPSGAAGGGNSPAGDRESQGAEGDYASSPGNNDDKEAESMATLYKALVTTDRDPLRVRDAPQTGRIIGHVPRGKTVDVLTEGSWPRIRYGELAGYASADYLTRVVTVDDGVEDSGWMSGDEIEGAARIVIRDSAGNIYVPVGAFTASLETDVD